MNLSIRCMTEADLEVADTIVRSAYTIAESRKKTLRRYMLLQPDGWFIAILGDTPVGLVGAINYGPFAYIGLLSVIPLAQRRGIGRALMAYLLAWLDEIKCPTLLLDATEDGLALYQHLHFIDEDRAAQWQRTEPPLKSLPAERLSTSRISPFQLRDMTEVTAFDAHYFGAGRAIVFASLLNEHPSRAFVLRNAAGRIAGYVFAQESSIGPWVASSMEEAEMLFAQALTLPFHSEPLVSTSLKNTSANLLLTQYGFKQQRLLYHMRRGEQSLERDRTKLYGQTSFALG